MRPVEVLYRAVENHSKWIRGKGYWPLSSKTDEDGYRTVYAGRSPIAHIVLSRDGIGNN